MNQPALPRDDQPGDYTGRWNQVRIRELFPDTAANVWHLALCEPVRGSYCGTFNPCHRYTLAGLLAHYVSGGTYLIPPEGLSVGHLVRNTLKPWALNGNVLTICPDCLSMARAEAELISQPKYRLRSLLRQFEGTSTPPA